LDEWLWGIGCADEDRKYHIDFDEPYTRRTEWRPDWRSDRRAERPCDYFGCDLASHGLSNNGRYASVLRDGAGYCN
jgi:hypothetical protein